MFFCNKTFNITFTMPSLKPHYTFAINLICTFSISTFTVNHKGFHLYFCLLFLSMTQFVSHLLPLCEISEGIYFVCLCLWQFFYLSVCLLVLTFHLISEIWWQWYILLVAVLSFICVPLLVWFFTFFEKSDCIGSFIPKINLVFSIIISQSNYWKWFCIIFRSSRLEVFC